MDNIRNFCIIAHIDHGKSTLADRMLEYTKAVSDRDMKEQLLDDMDLERERGITIKSHAIQMNHEHEGKEYFFNLIDTPGHVDFSYEVSRAIASCEGALLIIDGSQGVEAQTISNLFQALEYDLKIIPIINKVDLDSAEIDNVTEQIVDLTDCGLDEIIHASGKTGLGVQEILRAIVERIPPPKGDRQAPLQSMIFDSLYNPYRGVVAYFRVFNGSIKKGQTIQFAQTGKHYEVEEIGHLKLKNVPADKIEAGDVGYLISGIKSAQEVKVGDTITEPGRASEQAIRGFKEVKPMVFAGIFPVDSEDFEDLRACMEKLQLNDASLSYEPETSQALGFGFRCGFLGMLHMEIIQERLEREFNMSVITTVPNVSYYITRKNEDNEIEYKEVNSPSDLPDPGSFESIEEPFISAQVITQEDYVGGIIELCLDKRGKFQNQVYLPGGRVELTFELPLGEIVFDFYDRLKSITKGYASLDYQWAGYREADLVKLDIKINKEPVDALSAIIHRDKAYEWGKRICEKLKNLLPRQQFEIPLQAAIGSNVIARETIKALKKDVTSKCYGGDVSRKRKLLEKQKKGKKKMKQFGKVEIPQKAFMEVLKID